ncbi:MAG: alpha/beta hydrolase [Deltaproteobacteria bacterium]|nr:alpha/beta hydrolase [Deltaproteobacteria bacterium]
MKLNMPQGLIGRLGALGIAQGDIAGLKLAAAQPFNMAAVSLDNFTGVDRALAECVRDDSLRVSALPLRAAIQPHGSALGLARPGTDYAVDDAVSTAHLPRYPANLRVVRGVMDTGLARMPYTDIVNPDAVQAGVAVYCHGVGCLPILGENIVRILADQGFVVRSPVLRGHGIHEGRAYALDASVFGDSAEGIYLEDMPEIVSRSFADFGDRLVLAGYSGGGEAIARFANGIVPANESGRVAAVSREAADSRAALLKGLIFMGAPFGDAEITNPLWLAGRQFTTYYENIVPRELMFPRRLQEMAGAVRRFLLPALLATTPAAGRAMRCFGWVPPALAMRGVVNAENLTYEEFLRAMAGLSPVSNEIAIPVYHFLHGKTTSDDPALDRSDVSNITVPAAFIYGEGDPFANTHNAAVAQRALTDHDVAARLWEIRGAGHTDLIFGRRAYQALYRTMPEVLRFIFENDEGSQ